MYWFHILYPGNIIIKYGQVRFIVKSVNYYESYGPFFNFIFCKIPVQGEDGPGRGHLCHTDTFLVGHFFHIKNLVIFHPQYIDNGYLL